MKGYLKTYMARVLLLTLVHLVALVIWSTLVQNVILFTLGAIALFFLFDEVFDDIRRADGRDSVKLITLLGKLFRLGRGKND